MSNEKIGQEPAFACISEEYIQEGISKRFYAACSAMQGIVTGIYSDNTMLELFVKTAESEGIKTSQCIAKRALLYADELLKQERE